MSTTNTTPGKSLGEVCREIASAVLNMHQHYSWSELPVDFRRKWNETATKALDGYLVKQQKEIARLTSELMKEVDRNVQLHDAIAKMEKKEAVSLERQEPVILLPSIYLRELSAIETRNEVAVGTGCECPICIRPRAAEEKRK